MHRLKENNKGRVISFKLWRPLATGRQPAAALHWRFCLSAVAIHREGAPTFLWVEEQLIVNIRLWKSIRILHIVQT
ncbi:unnamed protein product [Mesocestoides corti]|uniref:Uncharacterized protein n=1 Tax=Mesocestoides corti TaxID=53468 RepID=A0A0R3U1U5_MESCO|nr:unnamed protein product [Mesocestoides corti]